MKRHLLVALSLLFVSGFASRGAAQMTYEGQLAEDGAPVNLRLPMRFEIFDAVEGGNLLWSETHGDVAVVDGEFAVELGRMEPLEPIFDGGARFLLVTIDGEPMLPRTTVGWVPYAVHAVNAARVGGYTADELLAGGVAPSAGASTYDNASSGLAAANVQAALDELTARLAAAESRLAAAESRLGGVEGDYVSGADLSAALSSYVTSTELGTTLASYVTTTELATTLSSYVTGTALSTTLASYVTDAELTTTLASYATTSVTDALDGRLDGLETLTASMSVATIHGQSAVVFEGVNLHVRNGLGQSACDEGGAPACNGVGNLVLGYDELRGSGDQKAGSHNVVVGPRNNRSGYASVVVGTSQTVASRSLRLQGVRADLSGTTTRVEGTSTTVSGTGTMTVTGGIVRVN